MRSVVLVLSHHPGKDRQEEVTGSGMWAWGYGVEEGRGGWGPTRSVGSSSDIILASVSVEIGSSLRVGANSEADPALHKSTMSFSANKLSEEGYNSRATIKRC